MLRLFYFVSLMLLTLSCQNFQMRSSNQRNAESSGAQNKNEKAPVLNTQADSNTVGHDGQEGVIDTKEVHKETIKLAQRPTLAIILGPGGLRSYAHAGFLQELAKSKIAVSMVGGLEMGALPAALFALKDEPFEAEWQMMKLKEEDWLKKGLLTGDSIKKPQEFEKTLKEIFGGSRIESSKLGFVCPSYSIGKKQTYLMNKGSVSQLLLYCLPAEPIMSDYQGNGANLAALGVVANHFRQKGAQLVVYVDLLAENNFSISENGLMWGILQNQIQEDYSKINELVRVSGLGGLKDFSRRRENLQKGQEAGRRFVQTLQTKYGF